MSKGARPTACPRARQGYPAAASVVVLLLMLAPGLLLITAADARQHLGAAEPEAANGEAVRVAARTAGTAAGTSTAGRAGDRAGAAGASHDARDGGGGQASDRGITMLREAAEAGRTLPYRGVRVSSWWGAQGTTTMVVDVAHEPGDGTLLRMESTGAQPAATTYVPDARGVEEPGSTLGVTEEALGLLAANYRVMTGGRGSAGSRPAHIVEAQRGDGTIAARFWLDDATKVPLRRELFDRNSRMINEDAFIDLRVGRSAVNGVLDGQAVPSRPWSDELTGADLATLRTHGWPLPARLPGGLSLFEAHRAATASGPVLQLGYSDGLSGVSLFVQRGGLPGTLAGYRHIDMAGHSVYARNSVQQLLTWAGRGHVYTVIADAPARTVDAVVGALPHDAAPGFWARLGRGFTKLFSWADPFR